MWSYHSPYIKLDDNSESPEAPPATKTSENPESTEAHPPATTISTPGKLDWILDKEEHFLLSCSELGISNCYL